MLPGKDAVHPLPGDDWVALMGAVKRFEAAWRQSQRPAIDDFLPAVEPLRSRVLVELVHVDLEHRIKAGEIVRVEEYLARYPGIAKDRSATLELIATEYGLRWRGEPSLSLEEYVKRFPDF